MIRKVLILLPLSLLLSNVECAQILIVFNIPSKSCHLTGITITEILAAEGHSVTIATPYKLKKPVKHFRHIFLEELAQSLVDSVNLFELGSNPYLMPYEYNEMFIAAANETFNNPKMKELLEKKEKFDLAIIDASNQESLIYIAEHLNVPVLLYTSMGSGFWTNPIIGNIAPPSYVPDIFSSSLSEMNFWQRLDNLVLVILNQLHRQFFGLPAHDKLVKAHFPGAPDISQYCYKPSVIMLNSDDTIMEPVPKVPGMFNIGGIHIQKPKSLPKDIDAIMNNAEHGVVYFSLGSNLNSTQLSKQMLQSLMKVFSSLKQTVLWKWEDEKLPGNATNIITRKWLPQNDILAHKNVKLFITHGGLHSLFETVYHGVPCLVMSVFLDQMTNGEIAKKMGIAESMTMKEFTEDKFKEALEKLLHNSIYTENVRKRSELMRDKPMSPLKTLLFCVEYVMRHNGAPHLKASLVKLNWYQYVLLDVIAFIIACAILFIILVKYGFTKLCQMCKNKNINKKNL